MNNSHKADAKLRFYNHIDVKKMLRLCYNRVLVAASLILFTLFFFTNRHEQFAKLTARSLVLVAPRR